MHIEIEYGTQVRTASGLSRQTLDVAAECSLAGVLMQLLAMHPKLAPWIEPTGRPKPGLLVFVNDQSPTDFESQLHDNAHLALMTLVSGG